MSVVIDWAGVEGLVLLSAVSTNWRAVAHSHPLFWRDIRLRALSCTALIFFHARLDCAQGRNINIAMHVLKHPSRWQVKSIVLPAVTRQQPHIVRVTLTASFEYDVHAAVLDALNVPKLNLQRLDLGFQYSPASASAVLLLPEIVARSRPKLASVELSRIQFPVRRVPAFETVESLQVDFDAPRFPVHSMFQQFPRLTALELLGDERTGLEYVFVNKIDTRSLSSLELCLPTRGYDLIFADVPCLDSIPDVTCWQPHAEHARVLLGHLDGPVEMQLRGPRPASGTVRITICAPACARTRTCVKLNNELQDAAVPGVCLHAIAARVTTLRMSAQLAYTASLFAELPVCSALELLLDVDVGLPSSDGEDMPAAPLRHPALARLTVKAVGSCGGRISADDLSAFLAVLVGRTGNRPALRLE